MAHIGTLDKYDYNFLASIVEDRLKRELTKSDSKRKNVSYLSALSECLRRNGKTEIAPLPTPDEVSGFNDLGDDHDSTDFL